MVFADFVGFPLKEVVCSIWKNFRFLREKGPHPQRYGFDFPLRKASCRRGNFGRELRTMLFCSTGMGIHIACLPIKLWNIYAEGERTKLV